MKNSISIFIVTVLLMASCQERNDTEISDFVNHWEITKTYETHINSKLKIDTLENKFKIVSGLNQVLILTTEKKPIFKDGKELSDLYSIKSLLIELNNSDNIVSSKHPANSKLFKKLIAFSPDHGINALDSNERIVFTRKDSTTWKVESEVSDFEFYRELHFYTKQALVTEYNDK